MDGFLNLLIRRAEELRGLGVEQAAVAALRLGVQPDADQFLVLVGNQRLAELDPLEDLPLRPEKLGWDALEEVRHEAQGLLDVGFDLAAVGRGGHNGLLARDPPARPRPRRSRAARTGARLALKQA
ncbi:hypothetical protein LN042_30930 [Kitasatospora sp. RB6PN24]|nr:hypothetical protein [Kitasatospora humi]MCC9311426.1 hypothetical protein [Kitasatospora humi]